MPPKIVRPPRAKTSINKPVAKGKPIRGQGNKKQVKVVEEIVEEEEKPEPPPPPKPRENAWLDTIKPIIKPDAELHKELSKKRRDAERIKHIEICGEELNAIFKFAMFEVSNKDPKATRREKINFTKGKYLDKKPKEERKINISDLKMQFHKSQEFTPPPVLTRYALPFEESIQQLLHCVSKENKFSGNNEMEKLLGICHDGNVKYTEHVEQKPLIDFPYLICIVGPQCSGKTSLAQHIASFLNVKILKITPIVDQPAAITNVTVINNIDEKQNIPLVVDFIDKLEDGQGLILINCPSTKGQISQLEKAIAGKKVSSINGLIRMEQSPEVLDYFAAERMVDKNSGRIFHKSFFPPGFISSEFEKSSDLVAYNSVKDQQYTRIASATPIIEKSLKKVVPVLTVNCYTFISEILDQLYSFLVSVDKTNTLKKENFPTIRFETKQVYESTNFRSDLFVLYNEKLLPMFGKYLGEAYSQISGAKNVIDNIKTVAHDRFVLTINVHDMRGSLTERFMKSQQNQYKYFNDVWDQANESRDKHLSEAEHVISSVGFNTLCALGGNSLKTIFQGLVIHYMVVFNFINYYRNSINDPNEPHCAVSVPNISHFNPCDLVTISELMFVDPFERGIEPPPFCVKASAPVTKKKPVLLKRKSKPIAPPINTTPYKMQSRKSSPKLVTPKGIISSGFSSILSSPLAKEGEPLDQSFSKSCEIFDVSSPLDSRSSLERTSTPSTPHGAKQYNHGFRESIDFSDESKCVADIREFLEFAKENSKIPEMKEEVRVMIDLFNFFISENEKLTKIITEGKNELGEEFRNIALRKHCNEMEHFSENLLAMLEKGDNSRPVFAYDSSDITGHLADLVKKAGGVPNPDCPQHLDKEKLDAFLGAVDKSKTFINVDELNEAATKAGLDEAAKAELELIVRMTTDPCFIEPVPLCQMIGEQMNVDYSNAIKKRPATSLH